MSGRTSPDAPGFAWPGAEFGGIGDEAGADLFAQVEAHVRLGWRTIELRTVDGQAIADLSDRAFARVVDLLADRGLRVSCVASRIGSWARPITCPLRWDLDELRALLPRLEALGTTLVRVMSYPNGGLTPDRWRDEVLSRMRRLADEAERAGVVLAHENCSGWAAASAPRSLEMLAAVGSPALRLLFDTGNGPCDGYDSVELLERIVDHVVHVHVKDAIGTQAEPRFTMPGDGDGRVADCLALLHRRGYRGVLSIEPHLHAVPHRGRRASVEEAVSDFVSYGRRAEALVHQLEVV